MPKCQLHVKHVLAPLHTEAIASMCCRYEDQGKVRPVVHRASLVEMAVPYGDPNAPFQRKCAFDVGDYGLGFCANSLALGCDCLGHIKYFDAVLNDSKGGAVWSLACVVARFCTDNRKLGFVG